MKLNKIAAGLTAAAVAASAMSAAASAAIKTVDGNAPYLTSASGMWMVMLYKSDGPEVEIDYGLDVTKIAQVKVQFTTDDTGFFDGMFGGALAMSCGPASLTPADHNWVQKNWWGVMDDDAEIWTQNPDEPILSTKVGDYTYEISMTVDDSNCFYDNATYCQAAIMEWGQDLSQLVVVGMQFFDADGNSMIEFDGNGNANIPNIAGQAPAETEAADEEEAADEADADEDEDADEEAPVEEEIPAPVEEEVPAPVEEVPAPVEEVPAPVEEVPAPVEEDADADEAPATPAQTEAAPAVTEAAPAVTEAAPAVTEAAADSGNVAGAAATQAPAAGNVAAATNSSKGSPDTGVADVAAVAGLAIVAGGAVLVAKKRK